MKAWLLGSLLLFNPLTLTASQNMVLVNAVVYQHPKANSVVIENGVITQIGIADEVLSSVDSRAKIIDLEQQFLLPGFIDNHNHVFEAASEAGGNCELSASASLLELRPYLEYCREQASSDGWLLGYGFSLEMIMEESSELSPITLLDSVFPHRPVILMEQTSHSMWLNSQALKLAGITKRTSDPQGGALLRDAEGNLNGVLLDSAGDAIMEIAWNSLKAQFEQSYQGLLNGLAAAAEHGITTIGDGRLYWKRGWFEVWQHAREQEALTSRVLLRPWIYPDADMKEQLEFLESIYTAEVSPSDKLIVSQVKMYSDGIIINGTAKLLAPYRETYLPNHPKGLNYIPPENMKTWLSALDKLGYSAHIHAIGDGAVHESLNAIEHVRHSGSDKPYTLTHVELVNEQDIPRFAKLAVTADFQVGSDYVAFQDHAWAKAFLGAVRAHRLMNLRAIFDTGANLTLSSDWNVHDINPLVGIANSIMMQDTGLPSVDAAIDAYTINAAKSLGIDGFTGSITVGKSADLVVVEKDIRQLSPEAIAESAVTLTMTQGEIVFQWTEQ
ncbi:amidohydrolase [Vibrio sp. DNB22_10_4]